MKYVLLAGALVWQAPVLVLWSALLFISVALWTAVVTMVQDFRRWFPGAWQRARARMAARGRTWA